MMQKNVASQKFVVFAFNRLTNAPVIGDELNITANLQKDFGLAAATNDLNPTELQDGFYAFNALQAETNANTLLLLPESTTTDVQVIGVPAIIYTDPISYADNQMLSVADIFNEVLSKGTYNTGQSLGKIIREISTWGAAEGVVNGVPTATSVPTNITGFDDDFFRDQNFTAYNGAAQAGQGRIVSSYDGTTGVFTFDEPFTTALSNGDDVLINSQHTHRITEISAAVMAAGDIDGYSLEETQKLILAASVGVLAGAATNSVTIEAADGSKTRITATVDANGNRSVVVLDVTG